MKGGKEAGRQKQGLTQATHLNQNLKQHCQMGTGRFGVEQCGQVGPWDKLLGSKKRSAMNRQTDNSVTGTLSTRDSILRPLKKEVQMHMADMGASCPFLRMREVSKSLCPDSESQAGDREGVGVGCGVTNTLFDT